MSYREKFERLSTEELMEYLRLDLASDAKPVLLRVLAARGVSPEAIEQVLAREFAAQLVLRAQNERLASVGARLAAFVIDYVAALLVSHGLSLLLLPLALGVKVLYVQPVLICAYLLFRDAIPGQSLGKRLLKLRVVRTPGEREMTLLSSFLRNVTLISFSLIDAAFIAGSRSMRLGDMLASTTVLRAAPADEHTHPAACPPAP